jgi:hypothetical protein
LGRKSSGRMLRQDLRSWTRTAHRAGTCLWHRGCGIASRLRGVVAAQRLRAGIDRRDRGLGPCGDPRAGVPDHTGNVPRLVGAWAEDDTDAAFKAAVKALQIHGYVSHISLDGYDIDAVAITPSGVVAIETEWHGKPPTRSRFAGISPRRGEQRRRQDRSCDRSTAPARPSRVWRPCGDRSESTSERVSRWTNWTWYRVTSCPLGWSGRARRV